MPHRILHVSDLHLGPPFRQHIADALVRQANEIRPDLLVISGDFVQRADFPAQWRAAQELCAALPTPQLVVPGNHDVPLYHAHLRLFNPLGRYRRFISPELNPVFEAPGLVVVGACTAHGLAADGGWLSTGQAATLRRIFTHYGPEFCKAVVWHHPVLNPPGLHKNRAMRGAHHTVRLLDALEVDLLLCGHIHVSYVGHTRLVVNDVRRGTLVCQCGTTTSHRGYGAERGKNSCNLIEVHEQSISVSPLVYLEEAGQFMPAATHTFPRANALTPQRANVETP